MAWKLPMVRPNCTRLLQRTRRSTSNTRSAAPTDSAACSTVASAQADAPPPPTRLASLRRAAAAPRRRRSAPRRSGGSGRGRRSTRSDRPAVGRGTKRLTTASPAASCAVTSSERGIACAVHVASHPARGASPRHAGRPAPRPQTGSGTPSPLRHQAQVDLAAGRCAAGAPSPAPRCRTGRWHPPPRCTGTNGPGIELASELLGQHDEVDQRLVGHAPALVLSRDEHRRPAEVSPLPPDGRVEQVGRPPGTRRTSARDWCSPRKRRVVVAEQLLVLAETEIHALARCLPGRRGRAITPCALRRPSIPRAGCRL